MNTTISYNENRSYNKQTLLKLVEQLPKHDKTCPDKVFEDLERKEKFLFISIAYGHSLRKLGKEANLYKKEVIALKESFFKKLNMQSQEEFLVWYWCNGGDAQFSRIFDTPSFPIVKLNLEYYTDF